MYQINPNNSRIQLLKNVHWIEIKTMQEFILTRVGRVLLNWFEVTSGVTPRLLRGEEVVRRLAAVQPNRTFAAFAESSSNSGPLLSLSADSPDISRELLNASVRRSLGDPVALNDESPPEDPVLVISVVPGDSDV